MSKSTKAFRKNVPFRGPQQLLYSNQDYLLQWQNICRNSEEDARGHLRLVNYSIFGSATNALPQYKHSEARPETLYVRHGAGLNAFCHTCSDTQELPHSLNNIPEIPLRFAKVLQQKKTPSSPQPLHRRPSTPLSLPCPCACQPRHCTNKNGFIDFHTHKSGGQNPTRLVVRCASKGKRQTIVVDFELSMLNENVRSTLPARQL